MAFVCVCGVARRKGQARSKVARRCPHWRIVVVFSPCRKRHLVRLELLCVPRWWGRAEVSHSLILSFPCCSRRLAKTGCCL